MMTRTKPEVVRGRESPSQCHFLHHISPRTDVGLEPGIRNDRPAVNSLRHNKAFKDQNEHALDIRFSS